MTYLDWASTSPPDRDALLEAADVASNSFGNPSSKHALGSDARAKLEEARARLLEALVPHLPGILDRGRIVLTSGGSEADAMVLLSLLRKKDTAHGGQVHMVSSAIEHAAVYEQARLLEALGVEVSFIEPGPDGRLSPDAVAQAIRKETALVAVMAVNNETGAIQPLADIVSAVKLAASALGMQKAPPIHVDAVQALGKIPFDPSLLALSSAAFSAHKIRGPRGTGALWLAKPIDPLAVGGGQEGGLRPGTENLQGTWAFSLAAAAARASLDSNALRARELESRLIDGLASIPGTIPLPIGRQAGDTRYSPFILSTSFPGISGEVLARALSDLNIAVSTGAACSHNAKRKGRRVLEAMGIPPELAFSSIRVSTGPTNGPGDIDFFLESVSQLYRRLKI